MDIIHVVQSPQKWTSYMLHEAHKNGHHLCCTRPTKTNIIHVVQGPQKRTSCCTRPTKTDTIHVVQFPQKLTFMLYKAQKNRHHSCCTRPRKTDIIHVVQSPENGHYTFCMKPTKTGIIQVVQSPQKQTSFMLYKGHNKDTIHAALGPHAHQNKKGAHVLTTVRRPHRNRMRSPSRYLVTQSAHRPDTW